MKTDSLEIVFKHMLLHVPLTFPVTKSTVFHVLLDFLAKCTIMLNGLCVGNEK